MYHNIWLKLEALARANPYYNIIIITVKTKPLATYLQSLAISRGGLLNLFGSSSRRVSSDLALASFLL